MGCSTLTKQTAEKVKKWLKGKPVRALLLGFDRLLSKRWYLGPILVFIIDVAFSLGLHFSESLGFVTNNGKELSLLGKIVYGTVMGLSLLIVLANSYAAHYRKKGCLNGGEDGDEDDEVSNYDAVLEGLSYVSSECVSDLIETLAKVRTSGCDYPQVLTNPSEHLRMLSERLAATVATLFSVRSHRVRSRDVHASIHYCFPNLDNSWHIVKGFEQYDGLSIQELLQEGTTFYEVLHSPDGFKFYNSKAEAQANKHYTVDNKDVFDNEGKPLGSIACYKVELMDYDRVVYARAIISISTRSKRFLDKVEPDELRNVEYNLKTKVFYEFVKQIAVELALLYIKMAQKKSLEEVKECAGVV